MAEDPRSKILIEPWTGRPLGPVDAPPERTRMGKFLAALEKLASAFARSDGMSGGSGLPH